MFPADPLDYHRSDAASGCFGRLERHKHIPQRLRRHPAPGIGKFQHPEIRRGISVDRQHAAVAHRLYGIAYDIVKRLFELFAVAGDRRELGTPRTLHLHLARFDLRTHEVQHFDYDLLKIDLRKLPFSRADRS